MERKCAEMPFRKKKRPVGQFVDQAIDQASGVVDAALPVIESAVTTAREQLREISKDAAENAKELAKDTRVKAAPLVAEGKSLAGEIAEATREVAIPKAKEKAAAGAATAAGLAATGRELAQSKVAEARGEPPKKKGGKLRKVLIFGTLAAAAGFVLNRLRGNQQADNWQSSYTPPTSTVPTGSTTSATTSSSTGSTTGSTTGVPTTGGTHLAPGVGPDEPVGVDDPMAARSTDDPAGASPDEALADAVEEPHAVTTPDDPAEVVDVESDTGKK